jgi:hypothetical protein
VGTAATPVARLEGALAHGSTPQVFEIVVGRFVLTGWARDPGAGTNVPLLTATSQRYGWAPNASNRCADPLGGRPSVCPADTPDDRTLIVPQACIAEFRVASVAPRLHFTSCHGLRGLLRGTSPPCPGAPGRRRCTHAQVVDNTVE